MLSAWYPGLMVVLHSAAASRAYHCSINKAATCWVSSEPVPPDDQMLHLLILY
uniref:Uncharacterized protein n=1 Tax=Arundo donax TaxID=35708 RepID=A0A0A9D1F6_ARUDO